MISAPTSRPKTDPLGVNRHQVDPIALFEQWFQEALASGLKEPRAMSVATVDETGSPDVRMLLLKGVDARGFVFFTNLRSPKAKALLHDSRVALCFYWAKIDRQIRIRGHAEPVPNEEADAYFATRPRLSQIAAWASKQSMEMGGYFELEAAVARMAVHFGVQTIPRPPFWSGFRVRPDHVEFWRQKPFRCHQRIVYQRTADGWQFHWLYP